MEMDNDRPPPPNEPLSLPPSDLVRLHAMSAAFLSVIEGSLTFDQARRALMLTGYTVESCQAALQKAHDALGFEPPDGYTLAVKRALTDL